MPEARDYADRIVEHLYRRALISPGDFHTPKFQEAMAAAIRESIAAEANPPARVAELEAVLAFYADERNHRRKDNQSRVADDYGTRARHALKGKEQILP